MKFLKILKEYNQAIIKENQRLKRVYATLVRESEEDNENLDGEEQEFIEPPAEGNSEEDDTEETTDGGNPDGGTAGSSDGGTAGEGSQENESDDIMQSGDEFYGEGGMNEGLGGALGAVGGAIVGANAADWFDAGKGSEEYQAAAKGVEDAAAAAKAADVDISNIKIDTDIPARTANTAPDSSDAIKIDYQDALKNLDSVKAGAPSEVGKFFKDNKWAGAAAGGLGGYAVGSAFDKDDEKNVAEAEQPSMTAEEFFGESDTDGWQTPKEFYGEAEEEPPIPDDDFFGEGEDHGAFRTPASMSTDGEELMSAQDFLAGEDGPVLEGIGAAVGAAGGAALGAWGAPQIGSEYLTPTVGAGLGAAGGYFAGKAIDKHRKNESEKDDELMLAEDFFQDDVEDDGEMIPETDFFAEAAAMKA